jgi:hypothetical protein
VTLVARHYIYGSDGSDVSYKEINETTGTFFEDTMHQIHSKLRTFKKQHQSYDNISLEQLWNESLPKDEMPPEYFDPSKKEHHLLNYYKSMQEQVFPNRVLE